MARQAKSVSSAKLERKEERGKGFILSYVEDRL